MSFIGTLKNQKTEKERNQKKRVASLCGQRDTEDETEPSPSLLVVVLSLAVGAFPVPPPSTIPPFPPPNQPHKPKNTSSYRPRPDPDLSLSRRRRRRKAEAKMMHMTLYWGTKVTLLIDSWQTDSLISYLLTLLACFIFSAFYQYMEDRRIRFKSLSSQPQQPQQQSINTPLLAAKRLRMFTPAKVATAVLFGINSAIGYLLMLAVMSFNGGVFLAIVGGLGVGYLLFRSGDEDAVVVENPCACA